MARILVFTPTYGGLLERQTVESIEALAFDGDWVLSDENRYPGRDTRNCVYQFQHGRALALAGGYDGLLTVEHDMVVPADAAERLWESPGDVVYGCYQFRHRMGAINLFQWLPEGAVGMSLSQYPRALQAAQVAGWCEVSGVGFGCTLIRRDVLERIPFRDVGSAPDMPFAQDCVAAGVRQVGRTDVVCGHIDRDSGMTLWPFGDEESGMAIKVVALQNVTVSDDGRPVVMRVGHEYALGQYAAFEAARAGFVRVLTQPGRETATAAGYETATAPSQKIVRRGLTDISGIGVETEKALSEIGIVTFEDLAGADPGRLAKLKNVSLRQAKSWVSDAIGFLA